MDYSGVWHSRHMRCCGVVVTVHGSRCRHYMCENCGCTCKSSGVQHCCGCGMSGVDGNRGSVHGGSVVIAVHCCCGGGCMCGVWNSSGVNTNGGRIRHWDCMSDSGGFGAIAGNMNLGSCSNVM